ncbi:hypothetical protein K466DRAFT_583509 [Polyporus arcularius HHB13444]|uniref:Uncharacterized protein n=1 Tax=Polyporus arcularius HHB13444 TaxID=1314778 RepID=A0A5C3PNY2_9APHY|nr:hypothetical protein K466DRAFT_583509 [Polyporus arcularius HHB13444]
MYPGRWLPPCDFPLVDSFIFLYLPPYRPAPVHPEPCLPRVSAPVARHRPPGIT